MRSDFTRGVFAVLTTLALLFGGFEAFQAYKWKKVADKRGFYAEQAGAYLFAPSGVTSLDGLPVTRAELADYVLYQAATQLAQQGKVKFTKK